MTEPTHAPFPVSTETVPGAPRLAVDHAGEGEHVLFLHGIGGNRTNWAAQLAHFAPGYHALAWDMRGYGASDDYEGPFRFADACSDIERVLDHFGARACHLIGLSLGGRIGFGFAHRCPARVLSLTACSAVPFADDMPPDTRRQFLERRKAPLLAGKTPGDIAPEVARSLAGPRCPEAARDALVGSIAALHRDSYLKTLDGAANSLERFDLASLRIPVHVVGAGFDTLFNPTKVKSIAGMIPGARYSELADAGHVSNLEFPEAFNRVVLAYLQGLRQRAGAS